jgi:hypothetical protein
VVGAEIKRLRASPFYRSFLRIEQQVQAAKGSLIGLRVEELTVEPRLLEAEDLLNFALIDPALALQRTDPAGRIVVLIDALDEIRYHDDKDNIVTWLINCPALPENIRFVLTTRPNDEAVEHFRAQQESLLCEITIGENSRANVLAAVVPRLRLQQIVQVVDIAVRMVRDPARAIVFAGLAPHLPPAQLEQVLAAAGRLYEHHPRAIALAALAPRVSPPLRQRSVLMDALDAAEGVLYGPERVNAIRTLAGVLPADLFDRAVEVAQATRHHRRREVSRVAACG